MMMKTYKVYEDTNLDELETPCYLIASNGLFRFNHNRAFKTIAKVDKMKGMAQVEEGTECYLPKMPNEDFQRVVKFFQKVYEKYQSEAMVLIYHNFDTGEWKFITPEQEVDSAHIDYGEAPNIPDYNMVGTIHSHGSMGAFHSGTDDHDEFDWSGVHITVGKVDSKPEYSVRYITEGKEFKKSIEDVVEFNTPNVEVPDDWLQNVSKRVYNYNRGTTTSCFDQYVGQNRLNIYDWGNFENEDDEDDLVDDYAGEKDDYKNGMLPNPNIDYYKVMEFKQQGVIVREIVETKSTEIEKRKVMIDYNQYQKLYEEGMLDFSAYD